MKLKFDINEDEVPGQSAKVGAILSAAFIIIAGLIEKQGIGIVILVGVIFALGGALAGWIIGYIIKLAINIKKREEKRAKTRAKQQRINQIKEKYPTDDKQDNAEYYDILKRKVGGIYDTDADVSRILNEIGIRSYLLPEPEAFEKICNAQVNSDKNLVIMRMVLERFITCRIENLASHPVDFQDDKYAKTYLNYVPEEKQNTKIRVHATHLSCLYTKSKSEFKIDTNIWRRDNTDPDSFKNTWANETARKVFFDE